MPGGNDAVVTVSAGAFTVIASALVAVALAESLTWTVKFAVPAAVGEPEIVPPGAMVNPAGSAPTETVQVFPQYRR